MTAHGGLAPRRPDQIHVPAPRTIQPGARILRLGGTPQSADVLNQGAQAATPFYTFTKAARIHAAGLTFSVSTDASYTAATQQLYARVTTQSGLVLCHVQLSVSGPTQNEPGADRFKAPEAGVPVAAGDKLLLDVNNGTIVTGGHGTMHADCSVFFTIP